MRRHDDVLDHGRARRAASHRRRDPRHLVPVPARRPRHRDRDARLLDGLPRVQPRAAPSAGREARKLIPNAVEGCCAGRRQCRWCLACSSRTSPSATSSCARATLVEPPDRRGERGPRRVHRPTRVDFERENNRPHRVLARARTAASARTSPAWSCARHSRSITAAFPEYEIKAGAVPKVSPGIREQLYLPLVWSAR